MTKKVLIIKSAILAILCLMSFELSAVMKGLSTEELTRASDIVIEGEVKDVKSHWSRNGKTIITRAIVINTTVIKGSAGQSQVIVEYDGGEIGDIGLKVSDVAPLKKNERVVLFLQSGESKRDGKVFNIVGKGQGKYTIGNDGIARKGGFSIIQGEELVDNNIPVDKLIDKIRKAR